MRLSFMQARGPRKALFALAALATLAAGPSALALEGAGVVVASSSPSYELGRVIEAGETLRLERGASVSILEESGRMRTVAANAVFQPSQPSRAGQAPARVGASIVESISALVGRDRDIQTPGGVRTLSNEEGEGCGALGAGADMAGLDQALQRGCQGAATTILARMIDRDAPPQLFVRMLPSAQGGTRATRIYAQPNFNAFLYCRVRGSNDAMIAVTPEPGALPLRLSASQGVELDLPPAPEEADAAIQCTAVGASGDTLAPDVGDWPQEFDPQRVDDGRADVASVLLALDADD